MDVHHQDVDWVPAVKTNVQETWKKFGWKPTTDEERKKRQREMAPSPDPETYPD